MKILLLKTVPKVGEAGEIKEVAEGYARNFLIVRGLAEAASESNLARWEKIQEEKKRQAVKDLVQTERLAEQLQGLVLEINGPASESGKLYAAITAAKISKKLKEKGFEILPRQIVLPEPIKEWGEYQATVSLDHGLEAEIAIVAGE